MSRVVRSLAIVVSLASLPLPVIAAATPTPVPQIDVPTDPPSPGALVPAQPTPAPVTPGADEDPAVTARAKEWIRRIQDNKIDRSQLDGTMNAQLTDALATAVSRQTAALGPLASIVFLQRKPVSGVEVFVFKCTFPSTTATEIFALDRDGKIAGIRLIPTPE